MSVIGNVIATPPSNIVYIPVTFTTNAIAGNQDGIIDLTDYIPTTRTFFAVIYNGYIPSSDWNTIFICRGINGNELAYRTNGSVSQTYTINIGILMKDII